ncbi:MAG: DUF6281 family protein [Nocardioides sp.]
MDGASDCAAQIRSEGVVYTSHGFTDQEGAKYAAAEEATCDDVGSDAKGSVFAGDSRSVTTWTFDGYSPAHVLGVRLDADSFAIYVSDSVDPAERDRIYEDLARERN